MVFIYATVRSRSLWAVTLYTLVDVLNSISACIFYFQKKRVWFPDPEVSYTVLFYAHDTGKW
jgi:hypothetical protein